MNNTHASPCAPVLPSAGLPPGWHLDETTGALMRDVIHRMGRRCFRWDYCGTGAYLITMTLADRSRPLFGRLVGDSPETAAVELSPLGREIDAHLRRIGEFTPEIEVLAAQLMPEHLHTVLRVRRRMAKPLGIALRGFAPDGALLKDAPPLRITQEFEERRDAFLEEAAHGAVLLSPCISAAPARIDELALAAVKHEPQ